MGLAIAWLLIIAFIIIMYIVLDGFTLGVGLLLPFISGEKERSIMLSTVLPVWDGNETWLVFAGAALYGAFPLAFSTLFPLWYMPIMVLVFGLLLRGISFEFRLKAHKTRQLWDYSLFAGSLMVVTAQGFIVASFVSGVNQLALHIWFSCFCASALIIAYSLLGCARLIKKTTLDLQNKFYNISGKLQWLLMLAIIIVGIYSPQSSKLHLRYWFSLQHSPLLLIVFIAIMLGLFILHGVALKKRHEQLPFISLIVIFVIAYLALIASHLPYLVPNQITFMQAKADDGALLFMLVGAVVLIPLLLFYTAYAYRIFGGKTHEKIGY